MTNTPPSCTCCHYYLIRSLSLGSLEPLHIDGPARWLCGHIGWNNRRPLTACVYHNIRKKFNMQQHMGYAIAQDGE